MSPLRRSNAAFDFRSMTWPPRATCRKPVAPGSPPNRPSAPRRKRSLKNEMRTPSFRIS
jgi:hypothetical protein